MLQLLSPVCLPDGKDFACVLLWVGGEQLCGLANEGSRTTFLFYLISAMSVACKRPASLCSEPPAPCFACCLGSPCDSPQTRPGKNVPASRRLDRDSTPWAWVFMSNGWAFPRQLHFYLYFEQKVFLGDVCFYGWVEGT